MRMLADVKRLSDPLEAKRSTLFFPPLWSKKEGTTNWSRRIPLGVSDRRPFGVLFPWGRSAVQMSTTLSSETGGILIALQLLPLQKGFALSLKVMMSDIYCWKILQSLDKDQVGFYLSFLKISLLENKGLSILRHLIINIERSLFSKKDKGNYDSVVICTGSRPNGSQTTLKMGGK